jgi:hypothetical protein
MADTEAQIGLLVLIDGKTVPLADCGWLQRRACGCIVAALTATSGDEAYATAEQARRSLSRDKRTRAREDRDGFYMELITMAYYREHIGSKWECAEHVKASA